MIFIGTPKISSVFNTSPNACNIEIRLLIDKFCFKTAAIDTPGGKRNLKMRIKAK